MLNHDQAPNTQTTYPSMSRRMWQDQDVVVDQVDDLQQDFDTIWTLHSKTGRLCS